MASFTDNLPSRHAHEPVLTPKVGTHWMLGLEHVALFCATAGLFVILMSIGLRPTDLWGHVLYGEWIIEQRRLPSEDPFFALAEGVPVVDSAWLSQLVFAGVLGYAGPIGLSLLFTSIVVLTYAAAMRAFYVQAQSLAGTPRLLVSLFATIVALLIAWSRLTTIRPENFGVLCFTILLWMVAHQEASSEGQVTRPTSTFWGLRKSLWLGVPILMVVWANLHGSFPCGLAVLGCMFGGHYLEAAWTLGGPLRAFRSPVVRGWLGLCELAVAATCLNPYGPELLFNTFLFANNANLKDLLEWQSLSVMGVGGQQFAISWILTTLILRWSRSPLRAWQILLVAVFATAAATGIRFLGWYGPVAMFALMPHLAYIVGRWYRRWMAAEAASDEEPLFDFSHSFRYTAVCGAIVFVAFQVTDLGALVFGQKLRSEDLVYGKETPLALVNYLAGHPELCRGTVFAPQPWSDWLIWNLTTEAGAARIQKWKESQPAKGKQQGTDPSIAGRSEGATPLKEFHPFMTSNVHLAPKQVWSDYRRVSEGAAGPDRVLQRYAINTVIFDVVQQASAVRLFKENVEWQKVYDDSQSIVFQRLPKRVPQPMAKTESKPSGTKPESASEKPTSEKEARPPASSVNQTAPAEEKTIRPDEVPPAAVVPSSAKPGLAPNSEPIRAAAPTSKSP